MPRRNKSAPHEPFRFNSQCKTKRRFTGEREALGVAEHQMFLKPELTLSVYKCELCGGWHLTRTPSSDNKRFR